MASEQWEIWVQKTIFLIDLLHQLNKHHPDRIWFHPEKQQSRVSNFLQSVEITEIYSQTYIGKIFVKATFLLNVIY